MRFIRPDADRRAQALISGLASGQRFIADVLRANRFCTLPMGLRTADECADGPASPGLDAGSARSHQIWAGLPAWLADRQPQRA